MSSAEYALRLHYRTPWGRKTEAMLLAQLLVLIFNIHRDKDAEPLTLADVLPDPDLPPSDDAVTDGNEALAFLRSAGVT